MARPKKSTRGQLPELSPLELEVMDTVWKLGSCSSTEVIQALKGSKTLADTTVRTVLSKIYEKGYLERVPTVERGYRFKPKVAKETVARRSINGVISKLFDGSPRQAILHLLKEEELSDGNLAEIRRLIEGSGSGEGERGRD